MNFKYCIFLISVLCAPIMAFGGDCSSTTTEQDCVTISGCVWKDSACTVGCKTDIEGFSFDNNLLTQYDTFCFSGAVYECVKKDDKFLWQYKLNTGTVDSSCVYRGDKPSDYFVNKKVYTCQAGQYFNSDKTACLDCPAGSECGGVEPKKCEAGKYTSETKRALCSYCPKGMHSEKDEGSTKCVECEIGTANNETGQSSCPVCEAGTYTDKTGQTSCLSCAEGYFCPGKEWVKQTSGGFNFNLESFNNALIENGLVTQNDNGKINYTPGTMIACPIGYFSDSAGKNVCSQCPKNKTNSQVQSVTCDITLYTKLNFKQSLNDNNGWAWPDYMTVDNNIYNYSASGGRFSNENVTQTASISAEELSQTQGLENTVLENTGSAREGVSLGTVWTRVSGGWLGQ